MKHSIKVNDMGRIYRIKKDGTLDLRYKYAKTSATNEGIKAEARRQRERGEVKSMVSDGINWLGLTLILVGTIGILFLMKRDIHELFRPVSRYSVAPSVQETFVK